MQHTEQELSVIIIEDHSIVIEGLCSILQDLDNIQVAGTFLNGENALEYLQSARPDVVFLDISLPEMSGIEVCRAIKQIDSSIKIIALSNHTEKSVITEMMQSGANGYLLKNTSKQDLVSAIFQVLDGQCTINGEVQKILFSPGTSSTNAPRLTKREKEILELVSDGITTNVIAERLFISPQTVETHRRNLMQKLEVHNTAALIKKVMELNLIA
ncbi:response regulator transcription factor [Mucilaginibacter sabulilitoris]|uniref:Response regulator transcription factor n=1 Tax=Mucilaginibacter sabulilitoris TaxID=1173583 RepID=A0ABZ0TTS9_9SPHI|nr:response regulator transcription factor [Mucilaginibacter sabulilitoris]WPU96324.1 response regulator transcription factor [Mucilaginibacter sabulilitoris]